MSKLKFTIFDWFLDKKKAKQYELNNKARKLVKDEASRLLRQYRVFLESDYSSWDAVRYLDSKNLNLPVAHKSTCVYLDRDLARDTIQLFEKYKEKDEYIKVLEQLRK